MASPAQKKTTFAKLDREARLRERRQHKEARELKAASRRPAATRPRRDGAAR
jgi:hypothetical protein